MTPVRIRLLYECALAAFWAAAERWQSKLPKGKCTNLESNLSAAEADDTKRQLLVASVEADTTKVRAADKRAFFEVAAAELAKPLGRCIRELTVPAPRV